MGRRVCWAVASSGHQRRVHCRESLSRVDTSEGHLNGIDAQHWQMFSPELERTRTPCLNAFVQMLDRIVSHLHCAVVPLCSHRHRLSAPSCLTQCASTGSMPMKSMQGLGPSKRASHACARRLTWINNAQTSHFVQGIRARLRGRTLGDRPSPERRFLHTFLQIHPFSWNS